MLYRFKFSSTFLFSKVWERIMRCWLDIYILQTYIHEEVIGIIQVKNVIHKNRMVHVIKKFSPFLGFFSSKDRACPCGMWHYIHNYMKYVQSCFLTRRHKLWSLIFLRGDSSIYTPLHYTINGDIPSNTKENNESNVPYCWWAND